MTTAIALLACFGFYCLMLWGMCHGATGGGGNRRADNIGFLIFAIVTYSIAVLGGLLLSTLNTALTST
jgi:hypothetical protein